MAENNNNLRDRRATLTKAMDKAFTCLLQAENILLEVARELENGKYLAQRSVNEVQEKHDEISGVLANIKARRVSTDSTHPSTDDVLP